MRETITVSITPELRAYIREQLTTGHYGSASEIVRAALRLMIEGGNKTPHGPPHAVAPSVSEHV